MPRFEPVINQFLAPEDLSAMAAVPSKPARPQPRKKSNSISALERIGVLTEATQRVKRRIRSVIAGAVGASTTRTKRRSCDTMHVDYVWNGWFEPSSAPIEPTPQAVPRPRQTDLPNFVPTINRYSVNMDAESISDVSMNLGESEDEGASTPRANSPEPGTPVASTKKLDSKPTNESENDEEGNDHQDHDDCENEEDDEGEDEVDTPSKDKSEKKVSQSNQEDDLISLRSPMDEDPKSAFTPQATSPLVLSYESPRKPTKSFIPALEEDSDERSPSLASRTSSNESSPPKTPTTKLTLITNFNPTPPPVEPLILPGAFGIVTESPVDVGFDFGLKLKELDSMEVILPTAISQDGYAPYVVPQQTFEVAPNPVLLPAPKLVEKKTGHKSRRSSRASETETIVCSPRRASILAAKKNSQGSLKAVERSQDLVSPTTVLRAQIDSLPAEQDDTVHAWGVWKLQATSPFSHRNSSEYSVLTIQHSFDSQ